MDSQQLTAQAIKAREYAYAPYSHFAVGAALEDENGKLYMGCNIESASYGPTNCAERTAFFKAVSEGVKKFKRIAVVGGKEGKDVETFCPPCGVCRQVMMEFCDPDNFEVVLADGKGTFKVFKLKELLPCGFGPANLQ